MTSAAARPEFLMCPADFFEIRYEINAWMEGNTGRSRRERARQQWRALHDELARRATVQTLPPVAGLPDLVFTANAGLVVGNRVVLGRFRFPERKIEEPLFRKWFEEHGYEVLAPPPDVYFEARAMHCRPRRTAHLVGFRFPFRARRRRVDRARPPDRSHPAAVGRPAVLSPRHLPPAAGRRRADVSPPRLRRTFAPPDRSARSGGQAHRDRREGRLRFLL